MAIISNVRNKQISKNNYLAVGTCERSLAETRVHIHVTVDRKLSKEAKEWVVW